MIIHNLRLAELRHMVLFLFGHTACKCSCRCDFYLHIALVAHREDSGIRIHSRDLSSVKDLVSVRHLLCHMSGDITHCKLRLRVQRDLHGVFICLDRLIVFPGDRKSVKSTGTSIYGKAERVGSGLSVFFHRDLCRPPILRSFCLADRNGSPSCQAFRLLNLWDHRISVLILSYIDAIACDLRCELGSPGETC